MSLRGMLVSVPPSSSSSASSKLCDDAFSENTTTKTQKMQKEQNVDQHLESSWKESFEDSCPWRVNFKRNANRSTLDFDNQNVTRECSPCLVREELRRQGLQSANYLREQIGVDKGEFYSVKKENNMLYNKNNAHKGEEDEALTTSNGGYEEMQEGTYVPQALVAILKACAQQGDLHRGSMLHADIVRLGLVGKNVFVSSALVSMYAKCGLTTKALEVFKQLPVRDVVLWNTLIAGYARLGHSEQAMICFEQMQFEGISPDAVTYTCILKASGSLEAAGKGQEVHAQIIRQGLLQKDIAVGNALVDMYAKCGELTKAQEIFNHLPLRDVISWSALIAGYAQQGHGEQALGCFEGMQLAGLSPNAVTYVGILKACGRIGSAAKGQEVHAKITKEGLPENEIFLGTALVDMYARCNLLAKAQEVFDSLLARNTAVWSALIAGYAQHGHDKDALNCFELMQVEGISPNAAIFVHTLKACGSIGAVEKGQEVHSEIIRKGLLESYIVLGNTLVDMYSKCGLLEEAQGVFDTLPVRNVVSWSALIAGYAQHGHGKEALRCYEQVQLEGLAPNAVTFVCILKACGSIGAADKGRELHAAIIMEGLLEKSIFVGNSLVDLYVKCDLLAKAQEMFDKLAFRDVISWNVLIAGYVQHGLGEEAVNCFEQMQLEGLFPDTVTFLYILKACGTVGALKKGEEIHAEVVRKQLLKKDTFVGNAVVDMYAKCGLLAKAQEVFDHLPVRSVVSWSVLIAGYALHGHGEEALDRFERMQLEGISPNVVTYVGILQACASIGASEKGQKLHAQIDKEGLLEKDVLVGTALVDMYAKCGMLSKAQEVFNNLPSKDVVSWSALIGGYTQHGNGEKALSCFEEMKSEGHSPNIITMVCILKACGSIGAAGKGQDVHDQIIRARLLEGNKVVGNTLLDMYMKCGLLAKAQEVFDNLSVRDVISWNVLITGYALLGRADSVFQLFDIMVGEGVRPDIVTFIAVLNVCSHTGLLDKGQKYFEDITTGYGTIPSLEHHTCMIDLFGRAGHVYKAVAVIKEMPFSANLTVWHTVLAACRYWGHTKLGRLAFEYAVHLDGNDVAAYVCMSNIYADAEL